MSRLKPRPTTIRGYNVGPKKGRRDALRSARFLRQGKPFLRQDEEEQAGATKPSLGYYAENPKGCKIELAGSAAFRHREMAPETLSFEVLPPQFAYTRATLPFVVSCES